MYLKFILLCCRVRPIGSTSEADTEFDRMKQVGILCFKLLNSLFIFALRRLSYLTNPELTSLVLQEILDEVVRELHKVKDEIINGKQCL